MRSKQELTGIWVKLFPQFAGSSATLQGRVKEMMVHSILVGLVPAGARIPPSRSLAEALVDSLELTPFHGHLMVQTEGVRDEQIPNGVRAGVPPATH